LSSAHDHGDQTEAIEALARTVAHLAVQLTIAQMQLRGLGSVLAERGIVRGDEVLAATSSLASDQAGAFLRENLGEALANLIEVDPLVDDVISFLAHDPA
jgi:hypothetical protein